MNFVLVMPIYRRPKLTSFVLRHWHRQIHRLRGQVNLHLVCVGSEGGESSSLITGLTDVMSYIEHENEPLSAKWNAGVQVAKHIRPDAVISVGSDDILSDEILLAFQAKLLEGHDLIGLRDLWFFDIAKQYLGYWPGYTSDKPRFGEPVGCGRCHSRKVLDAVGWQLYPTTATAKPVTLDSESSKFFTSHGFTFDAFSLNSLWPGAKAVDIKSDLSLTTFDRIKYEQTYSGSEALQFFANLLEPTELDEFRRLSCES